MYAEQFCRTWDVCHCDGTYKVLRLCCCIKVHSEIEVWLSAAAGCCWHRCQATPSCWVGAQVR